MTTPDEICDLEDVKRILNEIKTADQLKAVIEKWLFADDPSHWGRFEKALDAALNGSTQGEEKER